MNKTQLIEAIASVANVKESVASDVLNAFTHIVTDAIADNDKVQITGFGTFKPSVREAHNGRNPKTGESVRIPEKKSAKFEMGKELNIALNK